MGFFDLFKKKTKTPKQETTPELPKTNKLNLGSFNVSEADLRKIKSLAKKDVESGGRLYDINYELYLLRNLSPVMDVSVTENKTRQLWNEVRNCTDDNKKNKFYFAIGVTIASVDQCLSFINSSFLKKRVAAASYIELLKAWNTLDYFAHIAKPDFTVNIKHFRDYISIPILEFIKNIDRFHKYFSNTLVSEIKEISDEAKPEPVKTDGTSVYISSNDLYKWKANNPNETMYELCASLPLDEKEPVISLYEDGVKTAEYCLQTEDDEDFSGKYFQVSVRVGIFGNPPLPLVQIDGFISALSENRTMTIRDIGYRIEGKFLECGGKLAETKREFFRGCDLVDKGLKYPGYTTPANIRLVGLCPECKKSFCFHGYAFYMAQSDIAYSDDGQDCCEIHAYDIDKDNWTYECDGKTFRYYNSFCCPYCGEPYIDYKKHPEMKVFGVSGCVHLGKKNYVAN